MTESLRVCWDPMPGFEDGESGLISAYAAGCHVVDVTSMDRYPTCAGLQKAKAEQAANRAWLPGSSKGPAVAFGIFVSLLVVVFAAVLTLAKNPVARDMVK